MNTNRYLVKARLNREQQEIWEYVRAHMGNMDDRNLVLTLVTSAAEYWAKVDKQRREAANVITTTNEVSTDGTSTEGPTRETVLSDVHSQRETATETTSV